MQAEPEAVFGKTIAFAEPTKADAEAVAAQATCPVSGQPLDAMGGPIKAERGDRSVFLCCPSCAKAVKADSEKFLGEAAPAGEHPDGHDHAGGH